MTEWAVGAYAHASPVTIGRDQTLATAHEVMRRAGIRHLPVLDGGKLAGVVTLRDLHLVETLRDVDPATVPVEEAMSADVYVVPRDASLTEVAKHMAEHKLGSAIVVEHGKVVGVFTTIDALRALVHLATQLRPTAV